MFGDVTVVRKPKRRSSRFLHLGSVLVASSEGELARGDSRPSVAVGLSMPDSRLSGDSLRTWLLPRAGREAKRR